MLIQRSSSSSLSYGANVIRQDILVSMVKVRVGNQVIDMARQGAQRQLRVARLHPDRIHERPFCCFLPASSGYELKCLRCGDVVNDTRAAYRHVQNHHQGCRARVAENEEDLAWRVSSTGSEARLTRRRKEGRKRQHKSFWKQKGTSQVHS